MPTGYSFNLDGTTLYLSLATIFVAQISGIHLPIEKQLLIVFTLMLTSKGVAGVPRASLVILLGTATSFGLPSWPIYIILGIDELMDMARTSVNVLGNCLATVVIARWEGEFNPPKDKEAFHCPEFRNNSNFLRFTLQILCCRFHKEIKCLSFRSNIRPVEAGHTAYLLNIAQIINMIVGSFSHYFSLFEIAPVNISAVNTPEDCIAYHLAQIHLRKCIRLIYNIMKHTIITEVFQAAIHNFFHITD